MDPVRTLIAAVMLLGAAAWDLRERRVPNTYWAPFAVAAAVFLALDAVDGEWWAILGAALVSALSYGFFRMGLWGGADAKGVMVLAFLVKDHWHGVTTLAAMDTMLAGFLLVLLWPIGLLVWNLARGDVAMPAMLLGWKTTVKGLQGRRLFPMQDVDGWHYRTHFGGDTDAITRHLEAAGVQTVWVTPQLPLLVFIAIGFGLTTFLGSPISWLSGL